MEQRIINNSQATIDVTDLPNGQYILEIQVDNQSTIRKQFIKF
ncbi:MAG: T9SS type A sorting domain-containing protein [Saprospiraceae bacterium]